MTIEGNNFQIGGDIDVDADASVDAAATAATDISGDVSATVDQAVNASAQVASQLVTQGGHTIEHVADLFARHFRDTLRVLHGQDVTQEPAEGEGEPPAPGPASR